MKKLLLNFIIFSLLYSCGTSNIGKVLRNEKIKTTDEFLVKKREPLTMPPDYQTLPKPGEINSSKEENNNKTIKNILKIPKDQNSSTSKTSSVEQAIINEINK
tara:strand:- start:30 stop:338 length:309 start_codon:yes stop_codon:yes gene_type:complete